MSAIFRVQCDQCDYSETVTQGVLFAVRDEALEVILAHPGESGIALDYTGRTLDQLDREGRLRYRDGFLCLSCGTIGYYGQNGGKFEGVIFAERDEEDHFHVPRRNIHVSSLLRCASCNSDALEIAGGRYGCLSAFPPLLLDQRWKRWQKHLGLLHYCPKCHVGYIRWECFAIS